MRSVRSCNIRRRRILSRPANRDDMSIVVLPAMLDAGKWPCRIKIRGRLKRHTPKHVEWVYAALAEAAAIKAKPKRSHHKKAPRKEAAA